MQQIQQCELIFPLRFYNSNLTKNWPMEFM